MTFKPEWKNRADPDRYDKSFFRARKPLLGRAADLPCPSGQLRMDFTEEETRKALKAGGRLTAKDLRLFMEVLPIARDPEYWKLLEKHVETEKKKRRRSEKNTLQLLLPFQ